MEIQYKWLKINCSSHTNKNLRNFSQAQTVNGHEVLKSGPSLAIRTLILPLCRGRVNDDRNVLDRQKEDAKRQRNSDS